MQNLFAYMYMCVYTHNIQTYTYVFRLNIESFRHRKVYIRIDISEHTAK